MKAIIPAAGYATRLYPLTLDKPKHLLEVKGKPIIEWVAEKISELGVKETTVVSNSKYFENFLKWKENTKAATKIHVFNDGTASNGDRLGQIGDIQFGIEKAGIQDDLLVVAGDNLFNFSLAPCHDFFLQKSAFVNALWDCQSKETARKLGVAKIDKEKKIIEFEEKPENPKSTLVSLGIYFVPKKSLPLFKQYLEEKNNPDKIGYFIEWLIKREEAFGFPYKEKWFDVGWKESLEQARREFNA